MVANGNSIKFDRVALAIAATASIFGLSTAAASAQSIAIDGSSTVYPITEAMAEEFIGANPGTNISVGVSGTGGGFSKFCAGETDISNASRPIKPEEMQACADAGIEYIEIPVAYDAVTVVIHPENDWATAMTVEQLAAIWSPDAQGVNNWSAIDPSWPDRPLALFGPGTDSGTFDYFTDEIVGEEGSSRSDYTASEDDNILVIGVEGDVNALGYFGYAYYVENQDRLQSVAINGVKPSPETVDNGTYTPLSRPIFIYVRRDAVERPEVASFVNFYLENAAEIVPQVGYVALAPDAYDFAMGMVENGTVGTVYATNDVSGLGLLEVLNLSRTLEAPAE
ncbi:MAG: PstS family phosphate ABC transporter substrate-binding protein [Synechococcales bacterium]|nr:PstS family phosphate ABC transporter substrate-binding protein [Synechococcales bacterium]